MDEERKEYISGIYNYCDRWCEKCRFTSRCLLFASESKIATFEIMNDRLPNTEEMKEEIFGINEDEYEDKFDWDDSSEEEDEENFLFNEPDEETEEEDEKNKVPVLIEKLSNQYLKESMAFIKKIDSDFNFSSTPEDKLKMPQIKKIYDNFETVAWYHAFIYVKLKRALDGKREYFKHKNKGLKEISKYDMDGTAKVAAISIKNSVKALNELHEYLPESGVEIVKLHTLLSKTFTELEKEFPDYNKFIRPGFDDK